MRIEPNLYLIGSGHSGFELTDGYDQGASSSRLSLQHDKRHLDAACAVIERMGAHHRLADLPVDAPVDVADGTKAAAIRADQCVH